MLCGFGSIFPLLLFRVPYLRFEFRRDGLVLGE